MKILVNEFIISASDTVTTRAAELFSKELKKRTENETNWNEITHVNIFICKYDFIFSFLKIFSKWRNCLKIKKKKREGEKK